MKAVERGRASLLTGAIGDALGAAVEFDSYDQIVAAYGENGIQQLEVAYGKLGAVTDDTQMTLVLADSLAQAHRRGTERGILGPYWTYSAAGYLRWYRTQEPTAPVVGPAWGSDDLFAVLTEQGRRGPGASCLSALGGQTWPPQPIVDDRKGCGTVMRVAPIGLFFGALVDELDTAAAGRIYDEGVADAAITHGHPTAHHASGLLAVVFAHAIHGCSLPTAIDNALAALGTDDVAPLCRRAVHLARRGPHHLPELGEGWIAEEALAIGLYCALLVSHGALNPAGALRTAAHHDGDSDSTASIAGQLIGAFGGAAAVPRELLAAHSEVAALEPLIGRVADRLLTRAMS